MKLNAPDIIFSQVVRASADHTCLKCGVQRFPTNKRGSSGMDCSHIHSRRHIGIRFARNNAKCLCSGCHRWWHENPTESGTWLTNLMGQEFMDQLLKQKNEIRKTPKSEYKEITRHYREQLKIIEEKRLNGVKGVIEYESWQ